MEISNDLKIKYLNRREKDLEDCHAALLSKDASLLERVGHQMKGNALTFGFSPLAEIGEAMEKSAKAQEWSDLQSHVSSFQTYLRSLPPLIKREEK